jgi:tetratricopeptide (TPR) repeat protein
MRSWLIVLVLCLAGSALAQQPAGDPQEPPRSGSEPGESSSRATQIDISPPKDDAKDHPDSGLVVSDAEAANTDVQEFHPWDPHRAMKDLEVGDFYLKRKNYRAALDRYKEALLYKPNDALANFGIGQCLEKLKRGDEARPYYEAYLKILPEGPLSKEAHLALDRLKSAEKKDQASQTAEPAR